jgi:micrococcal nuclease
MPNERSSLPKRPSDLTEFRQIRRNQTAWRTWLIGLGAFCAVVAIGLAITNWTLVTARFGTGKPVATSFQVCGTIRLNCIVDGDTFWFKDEKIRISNIDAPELPGSKRCIDLRIGKNPSWCDFELGAHSRDALRDFLSSGQIEISREGEDQYGRTLAKVAVNGEDAGDQLIAMGYAREWED